MNASQVNQADMEGSFSIDEIKGVKGDDVKEESKVPRKKAAPRVTFKIDMLYTKKGIELLMKKGKSLHFSSELQGDSIRRNSDSVMKMYREWSRNLFSMVSFEDLMLRIQSESGKAAIRNLMNDYRDLECIKYRVTSKEGTISVTQKEPKEEVTPADSVTDLAISSNETKMTVDDSKEDIVIKRRMRSIAVLSDDE